MLSRRSFLMSLSAMLLAQGVSGCSNNGESLTVRLLKDSIPPQLLKAFREQLTSRTGLDFKVEAQFADLYELLKGWQVEEEEGESNNGLIPLLNRQKNAIADLVTLSDYWLTLAIQEKLISPLPVEQLSGWEQLPARWQQIVTRNEQGQLDPNGQIWGAPYRWGGTLIAYRRDIFEELGWIPTDWSDLWRPELRDRISLLNQPREVIGLTLKKLGYSYNTLDLAAVPNLKEELFALHEQVKFYSSNAYLQPLILEDTWVAVGWFSDIVPIQKRYSNIGAVIPTSGTALWTDIWVQPASIAENPLPLSTQWIDFCWQSKSASLIALFTSASSPILLEMDELDLPKDLRNNPLLRPNPQMLERSDFLFPLPQEILEEYQALWVEMRESGMTKDISVPR